MSVPIPENPLDDLLRTLNLTKLSSAPNGEDVFEGPSQWMPHGRVYGGQVLAQSLVAATQTVETDGIRNVHSLHGYFLRPGDIDLPIKFSVDRLRDGRSFSTRRVQAFQNDLPIFSMIASFSSSIFFAALCCKKKFTIAIPINTPINIFSPFFIAL
jgi:acyl-CoA thioesterase-2